MSAWQLRPMRLRLLQINSRCKPTTPTPCSRLAPIHQPKPPYLNMRRSRDPHAPPPTRLAPQNSAIPPPFTQHAQASFGPTAEPLRTFAHPKNLHTDDDDAAVSNPEPAQAKPSSRAATPNHPRAAQVDNANLTIVSTPPAACFLGVSLEVRQMIYGYLWTPAIDVYIDSSPSLQVSSSNNDDGTAS